jgi:antagonist of KipI
VQIREGDSLPCESSSNHGRSLEHVDTASMLDETAEALRVVDGPQKEWFAMPRFYEQSFTVLPASNRMGIRLTGPPIARPPRELISEAVAPGAIQITNEGLPIVLGVEGQTIGGFPKIAHVIHADLDRLAQLRPGQSIRFERVDVHAAEAFAVQRRAKLKRWLSVLRIFANP